MAEEEEKPKILVDAATVVEAITTSKWSDEQKTHFNRNNIFRLSGGDLMRKLFTLKEYNFVENNTYTLLYNIEIKNSETLDFNNINYKIPTTVIAESNLGNIIIENCQFVIDDTNARGTFLYKSTIGEVEIKKSKTGYFSITGESTTGYFSISGESTTRDFRISGRSTAGDFRISGESTTGFFSIAQSTTGNFYIQDKSTTGNFYIQDKSTTRDFSVSGRSTAGDFRISGESTTGYFSISGESTTGYFSISGESTTGNFRISGESTTGFFSIAQSTTGNFYIQDKSTIGNFYIQDKSTTGFFSIVQSTTVNFSIAQSTTGNFYIQDKSTTGDFSIAQCTTGDFNITGESKTGNFAIANSYPGNFFIENSSSPLWAVENCFASFRFSKAIIGQCKLTNCQISQLHIQNQCEMELYVSGGQINHLNFEQLTLGKSSIVSLSSVQVHLCNMFEFTVLGNLYFRDINPAINTVNFFSNAPRKPLYILYSDKDYNRKPNENNIHWRNYYNKLISYNRHLKELKKKLDAKIVPTPTFRIVKSSLGKTEFTECDLKRFRVEYKHSKLTEIFISGGEVPDDGLKIYEADKDHLDLKKQLEWHEQKAAFFNQLKKVFSQVGNVYRETQYNSLSAKHQLQILVLNRRINKEEKQRLLADPEKNKKWKHKINRWWHKTVEIANKKLEVLIRPSKKHIKTFYKWLKKVLPESTVFDIITFYLNRFSNNHGASWGRAVVFTLLSTVCAYIVYLCSVKVLGYGNDYVFAFDWELVAYYFSFIDITHKPDFMKDYGVELTAFSRVVSFFSRILIGFCIYQFIAAFRRHGKQG